ncbi:MAG: peptidoglycan bridge formation glycyltransferase FemA/FemB family protein [Candidatus Magasanikbacteria bacterium]
MKQIRQIEEKTIWDRLVLAGFAPFAQSWDWGAVLVAEGKEVERLVVENDGEVVFGAQVVYLPLIFGWRYAFCPKGPVGDLNAENFRLLNEYFKKNKIVFWRFEPAEKIELPNLIKTVDINPRATLILDLQKSEEEILEKMHTKTRYNIRLAQKKNLEIKNEKNLKIFLELMKKTGSRDNFRLHETKHYEAILNSDFCKQITIYYEQKPLATAMFVGCGETFTYLFGASDHGYRQLMAPYLLQWEGIKLGKKNNYKFYDFFGVAPKINEEGEYEFDYKHQYAGVSRFKHGFGGVYYEAPGTFDLKINKTKYNIYFWLRKLRRMV